MRIYGREVLAKCHHLDKSCDESHFDSGDMFWICHVTSRQHMFKGLFEFMSQSPSYWVTTSILWPLVQREWRHKVLNISGDYIKQRNWEVNNFMSWSSSWYVTILNQFHNILRLVNVLQIFPFTTSETMGDFYL